MNKWFALWIVLKEKLHGKISKPPQVSEGDIWWASIGENIGYEINGKSKLFTRPVIILKKISKGFYFAIPTTSQSRVGSWYIGFPESSLIKTACLHQARPVDYRRLYSKLGELKKIDLDRLKQAFLIFHQ